LHGMNLIFEDRKAYLEKELLFSKYFKDNTNAYFINEGGASMEGTLGCSEIISELKEDYDHLFCACGTGTTAAGILNGIGEKKLKTKFHGIPVLKNNGLLKTEITQFLSFDIPFELHEDYHFGGYAKTTEALIRFIKNFIKETGVIIDPVYTGKMLFALFDLIYKDHFSEGSRILAIHTGGLLGLLGMKSRFDF
jgi:1-aminocyclopropane-1-carboxylate deaminase